MGRIRKIRRVRRPSNGYSVRTGSRRSESQDNSQEPAAVSVLVAAPTPVRTLFVSRMVAFEGFELSGVAESGSQAMERVLKAHPDIAVIDMDLDEPLAGLHLARNIQKASSRTGILILIKSLEGVDLRAEARTFGSSWSYMWRAMIQDPQSTEAILKSVGGGVHWVDPQLKRILTKVWDIAAQARDLERESLRELIGEQELSYTPASGGSSPSGPGIQSVSVGEGGRGQGFKAFNAPRRAS